MKEPAHLLLRAMAVVACAHPALAQVPLGPEFRVDTLGAHFALIEDRPHNVAMAPDGRFIVAWMTREPGPSPFSDIAARRFDANDVASGPDFPVNSYTPDFQSSEAVASDGSGNFVVVWNGLGPNNTFSVFGQRFDAAGARLGTEFRVGATTVTGKQPFVAMRPGGEFVVVWNEYRVGVVGRRFDAAGIPQAGEFQVSAYSPYPGADDGPSVDFDAAGNYVVVWATSRFPADSDVMARLFTAAGVPQGPGFQISAGTHGAFRPRVARAADGSFVVAWSGSSMVAQRFDPAGAPVGTQTVVASLPDARLDLDMDADGDFVIVWQKYNQIFGRRFEATGISGPPFQVSPVSTSANTLPSISNDSAGNFVVVWRAFLNGTPQIVRVLARRYAGGLSAAALAVDGVAGPASDGNGVLEPGETVGVIPSWLNANFTAQTFTGAASSLTGPGAPGDPTYTIADGAADYGTVAVNATGSCGATADCYTVGVTVPTSRPAVHWDAAFHEEISPGNLGAAKTWTLHVGDSFGDVPRANPFYRFVETLLHHGVTNGCTPSTYCPSSSATREQMAVFVLVAKEGPGFVPPACVTPAFNDVPASSPFCPWIEELGRRGVVSGCGGGAYCPAAAVSREQMAVFVLATKEPGVTPPACSTPSRFNDVPASSPFCRWIEELARRNVVTGCGSGNYCPAAAVTREQMAVFISAGFGLELYGP